MTRLAITRKERIINNAIGDVTDVQYKQAIISSGQGAVAALSAYNYIEKLAGKPTIKLDWKSDKK